MLVHIRVLIGHLMIQRSSFWSKGKIKRINTSNGSAAISFSSGSQSQFMETVHFKNDAFTDKFDVKVLRNLVTSPDESMIVFSALGHLYASTNGGTPARLTDDGL